MIWLEVTSSRCGYVDRSRWPTRRRQAGPLLCGRQPPIRLRPRSPGVPEAGHHLVLPEAAVVAGGAAGDLAVGLDGGALDRSRSPQLAAAARRERRRMRMIKDEENIRLVIILTSSRLAEDVLIQCFYALSLLATFSFLPKQLQLSLSFPSSFISSSLFQPHLVLDLSRQETQSASTVSGSVV